MKITYWLLLAAWPVLATAGVPRASCTYFGMLKDSFGHVYQQSARLTLERSGVEVARQDISGFVRPGINFQAQVDMDSGSGDRYADYAMREGETLQIVVHVDGVDKPLLEPATLTVPEPGTDVQISLTVGTDADGDGLPDEWEQQLMAASGGSITNIAQILPEDDFDGDGASNIQEYLAGTYAFLDYDVFAVEDLEHTDGNRFGFRFLSVPGKSYRVHHNTDLTDANAWDTTTFSLDAEGAADMTSFIGDGYTKTVYIDMPDAKGFIRIIAK